MTVSPTQATNHTAESPRGIGAYGAISLERYDEKTGAVVERVRFEGRILGSATSEQGSHRGHPTTNWAPKKVKCSACRWLEVTIYSRRTKRVPNCDLCNGAGFSTEPSLRDGQPINTRCPDCTDPRGQFAYDYDYVIYTVGNSDVPGEVDYIRLFQTASAFEVVELLTVRRQNPNTGASDAFMPPQHALALAQAASIDDEIREAYVNRAVA